MKASVPAMRLSSQEKVVNAHRMAATTRAATNKRMAKRPDFGVHGGDGGVGRDGGVSVGHEENRKSGFPGDGVGVFGKGHAGEKQITEKCDRQHNGETAEGRIAPKRESAMREARRRRGRRW